MDAAIGSPRTESGCGPLSGTGLGVAVLWLSLLVLMPLAAVVVKGFGGGWSGFWAAVTNPAALAAIRLTVFAAIAVGVINAVMGTLIAWVLVRDAFPGKRIVEVVIDIPFALPTIVAGLVLLTLYGQRSPIGLDLSPPGPASLVALLFVTLPFVVRTVQPVLLALDTEVEQAAASLGAGPFTMFRRIVLPTLLPAIASGAALAFAPGDGRVRVGAAHLRRARRGPRSPRSTIYGQIQGDDFAGAAAVSTVLLLIALRRARRARRRPTTGGAPWLAT